MQIDSKPNSAHELSTELGTHSNINKPDVKTRYTRQVIELLPFKLRLFVRLLWIESKASNCTAKNTPDDIDGYRNIEDTLLHFCLK